MAADLTIPETIFAGACAGLMELMVMHPLDTVKTRMQLATSSAGLGPSVAGTLRALWTDGGVPRLYRGLLAPAAQEPIKRAAKFTFNKKYNQMIIGDGTPTWAKKTLCGALAGATEAVTIQPFEFVKIRMQAGNRVNAYANTMDAVRKIAKAEGVGAFATGIESALWRSGTWNGTYFGMIFYMDQVLPQAESRPGRLGRKFVTGVVGGICGMVLNNPLDVVVSRVRNAAGEEKAKYRFMWPSLFRILREEGAASLYKGFVPKVMRLGPGGGIMIVTFDLVSSFIAARR